MTHTDTDTVDLKLTAKVSEGSFDPKNGQDYDVSIEIGDNHFRFCIANAGSRECKWLEDYTAESFLNKDSIYDCISKVVADHSFLAAREWKSVKVVVNTPIFTLIPAPLFRKEYTTSYLKLVAGEAAQQKVLHHHLGDLEAYNVFSMPEADWESLQDQFPLGTLAFYHTTSPLIQGALLAHQQFRVVKILSLNIESTYFTLIASENQQLLFCNRFVYANAQELTYLVLFTLNQLSILPEDIKVILNGEITPFSAIYEELSRFMPSILFGKKAQTLRYSPDFEELPDHRYQALFHTFSLA